MKKFIWGFITFLLLSTNSYSITLKGGDKNKMYDLIIKDYNNFISKNDTQYSLISKDIADFCRSIASGLTPMTQMADCYYNEFVSLATDHDIYFDEVSDTIYNWYRNFFRLSESLQQASLNAYTQRARKKAIEDWAYKSQTLQQKLFRDLDKVIIKVAEKENSYYLAQLDAQQKKENMVQSGSGFYINKKGYFVTNAHVIDGCKNNPKVTFDGNHINAKIIAKDTSLDLALLKANIKPKNYLNISTKPPKKLQKIFVAGYPFGKGLSDDLKFTQGIISSLKGYGDNSNQIQIDAAINPGNSGGPIVNEDGELVGVAVSGLSKSESEGIGFGIKSSSVINFLEVNNTNYSSSSLMKFSFNSNKLNSLLEDSTIYTFCK